MGRRRLGQGIFQEKQSPNSRDPLSTMVDVDRQSKASSGPDRAIGGNVEVELTSLGLEQNGPARAEKLENHKSHKAQDPAGKKPQAPGKSLDSACLEQKSIFWKRKRQDRKWNQRPKTS